MTEGEYVLVCELRILNYITVFPESAKVFVTADNFSHNDTRALFHIIYDEFIVKHHGADMHEVLKVILNSDKYKGLIMSPIIGRAFGETEPHRLIYIEEEFDKDQLALINRSRALRVKS